MLSVMLHRKFFVLFWLFTLIGVAGCYRITYEPYGTTYFTIKNGGKKTVLSVLDEYAAINGFIRTQEGSESLNEEYKAVVMNAAYKNQNDISYRVMNLLNHECFGLHAYDYSKNNSDEAIRIATEVKALLSNVYVEDITFYQEQGCKNAT